VLDIFKTVGIEIDGDFITFGGVENLLLYKKEFVDNEEDKKMDVVIAYGDDDALWVRLWAYNDPDEDGWRIIEPDVYCMPGVLVNALLGMLDKAVWTSSTESENFGYGKELWNWVESHRRNEVIGSVGLGPVEFGEGGISKELWQEYNEHLWKEVEVFFS